MQFYFAPMEGVTGSLYRRCHQEHFPGVDRYYIPFLEPREGKCFDGRDRHEIDPEENRGVPAVPQMLTNRADRFLEGALRLRDLGYTQVDLNLGCPARTVVTRGKGCGFLEQPEALERFLDEIFAHSPLPVSVKTRLGLEEEEEFAELLALYRKYPMTQLTVHARLLKDQYRGPVRWDCFAQAMENAPWPVCYNGDIFSPTEYRRFTRRFPEADRVMLGRGLIGNPGLVRQIRGGKGVTGPELRAFHDDLFARYRDYLSGDRNVLCWMKELWFYMICLFPDGAKAAKAIRKAQRVSDYQDAVSRLFDTGEPVTEPGYRR